MEQHQEQTTWITSLNEYQDATKRTEPNLEFRDKLLNYALGCAGEAGEIVDAIKKHVFHGHPIDRHAIAKEIGDLFWYTARMSALLGFGLDEIANMNIEKLFKRYPNGFDKNKSIHRKDE